MTAPFAMLGRALPLVAVAIAVFPPAAAHAQPAPFERGCFRLVFDDRGLTALSNPQDRLQAQFLAPGGRLCELDCRYRVGTAGWRDFETARRRSSDTKTGVVEYEDESPDADI